MFPKRYWLVLLTYFLMFVFTAIVPVIAHFGFGLDIFQATVYANITGFIGALIIIFFLMRTDLREEKIANPISFGKLVGWVIAGIFMAWVSQVIAATIETELLGIKMGSENTAVIVELSRINPLFILVPALIGPILEEFVFRKILFGTFYKKWNFLVAAILSSLIFAVVHMDLMHTLIYFAMGVVFAYLYVKTKRIIVPILVHMLLNTIVVTAQLVIDPEMLEQMQQQAQFILFGG